MHFKNEIEHKILVTYVIAKVSVDVFGNHGLCGLLKEGAHEKSPKCLGGNLGEFCKGLRLFLQRSLVIKKLYLVSWGGNFWGAVQSFQTAC